MFWTPFMLRWVLLDLHFAPLTIILHLFLLLRFCDIRTQNSEKYCSSTLLAVIIVIVIVVGNYIEKPYFL